MLFIDPDGRYVSSNSAYNATGSQMDDAPDTIYKNKKTGDEVEVKDGVDKTIEINDTDFEEAKFFANEVSPSETSEVIAKAYQSFYSDHVSYDGFIEALMDGGPSMSQMTGTTEFAVSPLIAELITGPGKSRIGAWLAKKLGKTLKFQSHHLIPKAVWKKHANGALKPFLRDGPLNLKKLPTPFHGNHPQYNIYVGRRIENMIRRGNGAISKSQMQNFQKELRHSIRDAYNSGQKLNEYFRKLN